MTALPRDAYDVVVVGAGPAGMAAAAEAATARVSVLVADDNPAAGGQVWRAAAAGPLADGRVLGKDYAAGGGAATRAFAGLAGAVDHLPRAQVWHLDDRLELGLTLPDCGGAAVVRAGRVVLATGALERPVPVPGWTLPGLMSVGAAQTALKAHGMVPDGRYALAGCGPLLWLYAAQAAAAGAPPALVLDTTPRENRRVAARHLPAFLLSPYARKGLPLLLRARRAVPVVAGVDGFRIERASGGVRLFWTRGQRGEDSATFAAVLLHHGVTPNLNLAVAAGCGLGWQEANACFAPRTDCWGRTTVPGVLLAGDGAGIAGAEAAALSGRIAALAALADLRAVSEAERDGRAAPFRAERARWLRGRPFLDTLYRPAPRFRSAAPDAVACRCEEVTGAQVAEAARLGATGPNQLKAWLRCGMGPCQGRMCGLTVTETIATARGVTPAEVGYLRLRAPVRPVTLAQVASLPRTEAERRAVERL
ncbi:NAD(P)/FAD-dependent oxidoreductase [Craurococcus roseus]|uniref:NAD(P)/FAD-dependent oxidoreductase n=1 Tax=Craurococcus roseus TaxID=77585 RepID=A0ABN1EZD8_9PROT